VPSKSVFNDDLNENCKQDSKRQREENSVDHIFYLNKFLLGIVLSGLWGNFIDIIITYTQLIF
jgi:hypothetical protein